MTCQNTALPGGHASDWSLAIHSNAVSWSLAWSLACLFDIKSGLPGKVASGKVKQLQAIDQTSDWSHAIHFTPGSQSLVQLNVANILTGFLMYMYLFLE